MNTPLQTLVAAVLVATLLGCSGEPLDESRPAPAPPSAPTQPAEGVEPEPGELGESADDEQKPAYGLPLEYHFDPPPVPERIQGPSPPIGGKST